MAKTETMVSCPFCRRVYKMMLDRALAKERGTRASCGRCGNSFELAARIVVTMNSNIGTGLASRSLVPPPPPPPPPRVAPLESALPVTAADIESDEASSAIAEEVARAAEDIRHADTRVIPRQDLGAAVAGGASDFATSPPTAREASGTIDATQTSALVEPMPPMEAAAIDWYRAPVVADPGIAHASETPDLTATPPARPSAPRDWLDRADPGLLGLTRPEPDTVVALRRLLP